MKKLFLAIIAITTFFGCKESSPVRDRFWGGGYSTSHYITNYIVMEKIIVDNNDGALCIKVSGQDFCTLWPEDEEEGLYFADLYNDNSYDGVVRGFTNIALAYPLDKITISCDKDFDANHPAGEPLDDIAQLKYSSFYPFIENGYQHFSKDDWEYRDCVGYSMNFDSINAEITKLVKAEFIPYLSGQGDIAKIEFASQPEKLGEYTFTLELTTNGETFSTEFTYTFE